MKFVEALIREPAVLGFGLLFLVGLGLPLLETFSRAITDSNGRRSTIVMRCLTGEAPLWVVYWLFGIVGGVLAGVVALFAAMLSPILGITLMSLYATWWTISLWQCGRNVAYRFFAFLARGLLLFGLLGGVLSLSGLIFNDDAIPPSILTVLVVLFAMQFVLVYVVAFFTGYGAKGRIRVSSAMALGMHRMRSADLGIQERPEDEKRREQEGTRYLEKGRMYAGDSDSHANGFGGGFGGGASC